VVAAAVDPLLLLLLPPQPAMPSATTAGATARSEIRLNMPQRWRRRGTARQGTLVAARTYLSA
jgi:hypothetical protein